MLKILYLEDDINLLKTITEFLEENNFEVVSTYSAFDALDKLYHQNFDLLIFDINLTDMNGFELLSQLRNADIQTPAIFTTTLNDIDSLDTAYTIGVDEYMRKPFMLKELLHRIHALLKREFSTNKLLQLSLNITFDITHEKLLKNNIEEKLTKKELQLLKLFIKNKNQLTYFHEIYQALWSANEEISEGSIRKYIRKLRIILGAEKIISLKGQGYKLVV